MIHYHGQSFREFARGAASKRAESLRNELRILVFALVEPSELYRIKQLLDLGFRQDLLLANDSQNATAALVGFDGQFRCFFMTRDGIKRRNDADCGFHVVFESFLVHGDSIHTIGTKSERGSKDQHLRFNDRKSLT